jgi:general secretion pathway protein G
MKAEHPAGNGQSEHAARAASERTRMKTHTRRAASRTARRAFSLMELMLVLIILGVLAAVAAYNLGGMGEKAKVRATKTSLATLKQMIKTYQLEHNSFPAGITTLVTAKYLEAGHDKDGFDRPFYYKAATGNPERPFDLISAGPDGQLGTADDINVWTMD